MINPKIIAKSKSTFSLWDDCMSLFTASNELLMVRLLRHEHVGVSFLDEFGQPHCWEKLPLPLSELLQHELDHLDGVLFIDRTDIKQLAFWDVFLRRLQAGEIQIDTDVEEP